MLDTDYTSELRGSITLNLKKFHSQSTDDQSLTPAAVVLGVCPSLETSTATILLTQRSSKLRQHAGQFALPGGKVDAGESMQQAALRELEEELGIVQSECNVLGTLDDMPTQSGFNITPVVVWIENLDSLTPNPDEVAQVYQIPLSEIAAMTLNLSEDNDDGPTHSRDTNKTSCTTSESEVMSLYIPSVGTTVYSPTAAIIYQFKEVAMLGKSTRVAHFGQPKFAWR